MDGLTAAYFVAFIGGAAFSVLSFLLSHTGGDSSAPGHALTHTASTPHDLQLCHHDAALLPSQSVMAPFLNVSSACAFSLVGGCVGFLARQFFAAGTLASLAFAVPAGLFGAFIVATFLRFLRRASKEELPFLYEGTLATVSNGIRDGELGEIHYLKEGALTSLPARSHTGPIAPGVEVIILSVARGVALVEPAPALLSATQRNVEEES